MAATYDITIEQKATFSKTVVWQDVNGSPVNITGWTARFQVKSLATPIVMLDLASATGSIVIDGANGKLTLTGVPAATNNVTQNGRYDLLVIDPGGVTTRLLQGQVFVSKGITG